MGSSFSTPEKLYRAVKTNNVVKLQELLHQMHQQGQLDPSTRRRYLEFKDAEGRTPLLLAAGMNSYHIAGMLLANGADITYMRKFNSGGTALHEAAAHNHEAMVELLLSHGAEAFGHPFLENYSTRTPIDVAVAAGHVNIVRRLEKCGLFFGYVAVKVPNLVPFSKTWKPRWCVVMRRFPGPTSERRGEADFVLWMFKDTASCAPLCKVSVVGSESNVTENGLSWEATLRLRPNHPKPADVAIKKEGQSYIIQFRPISSPNATPLDRTAPHAPNVVPEDAFFNLLRACNAHRVSDTNPNPHPGSNAPASSHPASPTMQAAAARPAAGYPTAHLAASIPPPPASRPAGADLMQALPGETDQQFAHRLAAMASACDAPSSMTHANSAPPPSTTPAAHNPPITSAASEPIRAPPAAEADHPQGPAALLSSLMNVAGSVAGAVLPTVMNTIGHAFGGGQPQRPNANAENAPGLSSHVSPAPPPASAPRPLYVIPTMPMTEGRPSPSQPLPRYPSLDRNNSLPSAPSLPSEYSLPSSLHTGPSAAPPSAAALSTVSSVHEDEGLCVICLSNGRAAGFLHGSTVHRCVCNECAGHIHPGDACPMCRQPVERILGVY